MNCMNAAQQDTYLSNSISNNHLSPHAEAGRKVEAHRSTPSIDRENHDNTKAKPFARTGGAFGGRNHIRNTTCLAPLLVSCSLPMLFSNTHAHAHPPKPAMCPAQSEPCTAWMPSTRDVSRPSHVHGHGHSRCPSVCRLPPNTAVVTRFGTSYFEHHPLPPPPSMNLPSVRAPVPHAPHSFVGLSLLNGGRGRPERAREGARGRERAREGARGRAAYTK